MLWVAGKSVSKRDHVSYHRLTYSENPWVIGCHGTALLDQRPDPPGRGIARFARRRLTCCWLGTWPVRGHRSRRFFIWPSFGSGQPSLLAQFLASAHKLVQSDEVGLPSPT